MQINLFDDEYACFFAFNAGRSILAVGVIVVNKLYKVDPNKVFPFPLRHAICEIFVIAVQCVNHAKPRTLALIGNSRHGIGPIDSILQETLVPAKLLHVPASQSAVVRRVVGLNLGWFSSLMKLSA